MIPQRRLYAVADGMGGHAAGDVAASLAIATLGAALPRPPSPRIGAPALATRLRAAFAAAHSALMDHGQAVPACRGMGSTMTALAPLLAEDVCVIAHIGDSRAYRLREGQLAMLTHDHTWVQQQVDLGMLSPSQAGSHPYGSVLVRVLGGGGDPGAADIYLSDFQAGDLFMLCTDGLSGVIAHADLESILSRPLPLGELGDQLVAAAHLRGAPDNVSLVLLRPR